MIYANITPLNDGYYWASLLIRNDAIKVKHQFCEILKDEISAKKWLAKTNLHYWRDRLKSYLNQREHALKEVRALLPVHTEAIMHLNNINKSHDHYLWALGILHHQKDVFALLPSQGSRFAMWRIIMLDLVTYAWNVLPESSEKTALNPKFLFSYLT